MRSEQVQEVLQKARKNWRRMWPKAVDSDGIVCPLCGNGGRDQWGDGVQHIMQDPNPDKLVCFSCAFEGDAVDLLRKEMWEKREAEPTDEELAQEVTVRLEARPANAAEYLDTFWAADVAAMQAAENVTTGFSNLDNVTGGIYPGLYVIGALSSLGKTTFALQLADNLAAAGKHVLFFSLEQSQLELVSKSLSRIAAQESQNGVKYGVDSLTIRKGFTDAGTKKALAKYREEIAPRMNIIQGDFRCDAAFIRDEVARYIQRTGKRPVVFVDYLQILQPADGVRQTLRESIDATVTALKRMSREYNTTVFVISSVNRSNYLTPIDFESFKESGGIEYTADVVWGMQYACLEEDLFNKVNAIKEKRDKIKEAKGKTPREIELVCLKNRYGHDFICEFEYYPRVDLFTPSTTEKKPKAAAVRI